MLVNGPPRSDPQPAPKREITLGGATAFNLMNMIGVGPFITLPLVALALGPGAWVGWLLGALLAVCDGLVWAELGAALPRAGGSYAYLREIYKPSTLAVGEAGANRAVVVPAGHGRAAASTALPPELGLPLRAKPPDAGRFLAFLYAWQLLFTAPLSVASGALGLAQYTAFLFPSLHRGLAAGPVRLEGTSLLAAGVCVLVVLLLLRGLASAMRSARLLTAGVLLTLGSVIVAGLTHLQRPLVLAQAHWPHGPGLLQAVGAATLVTTYDYWGYYNVCFLGEEVREPGRTIPRAVLGSIALVAVLYLLMNFAVLGALPVATLLGDGGRTIAPMAAVLMGNVLPAAGGRIAAGAMVLLIVWTAFASILSLLLGYSRAPYAAAREGNFFAPFGRMDPRRQVPVFALLTLGSLATAFCFFDLRTVISALVAVRIVLQYGLQQIGVIVLRFRQPGLPRPFRLWLYPLPPLLALLGFGFLLLGRKGAGRELALAAALGISGALLYLWRSKRGAGAPLAADPR